MFRLEDLTLSAPASHARLFPQGVVYARAQAVGGEKILYAVPV